MTINSGSFIIVIIYGIDLNISKSVWSRTTLWLDEVTENKIQIQGNLNWISIQILQQQQKNPDVFFFTLLFMLGNYETNCYHKNGNNVTHG